MSDAASDPVNDATNDATNDDRRDATEAAASGASPKQVGEQGFDTQYRPLLREAFVEIVSQNVRDGGDAATQADDYAERGKPDFVLAYLLVAELDDARKREIYARAHEQRAKYIEQRARQFSQEFHRPFPLLQTEAAKDRALARQIRTGQRIHRNAGRQLPTL
jgi:hypothetical protein